MCTSDGNGLDHQIRVQCFCWQPPVFPCYDTALWCSCRISVAPGLETCVTLSNCFRQTRHRAPPRVCVFSCARGVCVCVCVCVFVCPHVLGRCNDACFIDAFVDSPIRPMPRFILRFTNVSNASDVVVSLSSSGTFQFVVQLLC